MQKEKNVYRFTKIINLISSAVKNFSNIKTTYDRKTALLEMLKTYFLLLDSYKVLKVDSRGDIYK